MEDVALVRCNSYDINRLRECLKEAFTLLGGLERFVQPREKVLLKLSLLSAYKPETAVITHPVLVEALIPLIKDIGCEVYLGDSPGGFVTHSSLRDVYRVSGFQDVAKRYGVKLVDFDGSPPMERNSPEGVLYKKFRVSSILDSVDKIITIPKLKTHNLTYLTNAVKVNFGFIQGLTKVEYHLKLPDRENFSHMLLDLYLAIKPNLAITDAIIAMEGNGPSSGHPKKLGAVVVGANSVAVDYISAKLMGYRDPLEIPTNHLGFTRGLFQPEHVKVKGDDIDSLISGDFVKIPEDLLQKFPPWLYQIGKRLVSGKPSIDYAKCTMCNSCVEYCPVKCISLEPKKNILKINHNQCIRCFCCQELCPKGAIAIKVPILGKMVEKLTRRYR